MTEIDSAERESGAPSVHTGDRANEFGGLRARVTLEFSDDLPSEIVRTVVDRAIADFRGARIRHFLPILIERQARHDLNDLRRDAPC